MKQSTFSAFLANNFFNLLQNYTKGIRFTAMLMLLVVGTSNAWAYNFYSPHIYFNNADLNWNPAMLFVGHDSYSQGYNQTKNPIDNTKLVYFHPTASWSDQKYFTIGNSQNWGAERNGFYSRVNYLTHIGIQSNYDFNSNNTYYVTGSVSSSISVSYKSNDTKEGYKSIPTYDAKQAAKVRDINSGTYTNISGTFPATLKIKGTYLSGWQASTRSEISGTKSTDSNKYGTVVTGLVTHSYSNLSDDYQFDGWGTSTTPSSTNSTYEYNISAATTVYAFFTKKYAITFGTPGNGSITATAGGNSITSGTKVVGGSEIVFTASPATGYRIQGWYSDANCTNSLNNGTDGTYTINSLTTNATVYVKYEEIPEAKFAVTIQTNNANYGTVSPSGSQQVGASGIDITATAKPGYQFDKWTCTGGASVEDASKQNTTASATAEGTVTANFSIKNYTITYNLNGGTNNNSNPESYTVETETITLQDPTKEGFLFAGWYTSSTFNETAVTSITKGSTGNKILYAKWIGYDHCIFFKNTLGWQEVYVYTFTNNAYWDDGTGVHPATNKLEQGKMTQVGKTDIYYYILTDLTGFSYIAFSDFDMRTYGFFNDHKAVYRGDRNDQLQLFIPQKDQTPTGDTYTTNKYYNDGIWMKYNSKDSGYDWSGKTAESDWSDHSLLAEKKGDYSFTTTVSLKAGTNYEFKISNVGKDANNEKIKETAWYGWNGTMTQASCTNKHFKHNTSNNAMITPTVDGDYTFTVYLGDGKVMVSLEYPLSTDDYRLAYKDITLSKIHEGHYLKKRTTGEILDTVSFFVRKDKTPQILLQQCTNIVDGKPTWGTVDNGTYNITVNADGVYNFILKQTNSGTHTATLETSATHKYKGDYYIRTDASEGGWKSYRQASNRMNYSTYADSHSEFNHYFCSYRERGCNVKFIVANDYSECLTDTMDNDDIIRPNQSSVGCLPANANIRFGWDSETNQLSRAYISGAGLVQDRFLVLMGNEYLKDAKGNTLIAGTNGSPRYGLKANEEIFADKGNWIYQVDVQACNQTTIRLSALYNGEEQLFKGARNDISLLNSTEPKYYKVRMIYDFKTNHMISAWLLDEQGNTIEGEGSLASDILVIRKNQDQANQLTFIGAAERTDVGVVYGVMTFDKFFLNNIDKEGHAVAQKDEKTIFERALYWISFPFNVKLKDIFGFSNYGDHWILEEYNGEARAENGAWVDSESYWEYITDSEYELEAGKGYVLCLDLDKMGVNSDVFQHTDEVSLYFPSKEKVGTINGATTSITLQPYTCNIERDNRNIYDSNWHLIGVPRFADITTENINIIPQPTQGDVGFYYEYGSNGEYTVKKSGATTFQTMSAYLVQYAGVINWTSTGITVPAAIAARKNSPAEPEQVHLRLEIAQDDEMADQTFVQLQQEGATAEFDMNLDLTKMLHSGTNIYTLAGEQGIKSAGNVMPMSECVVPVGVKVDAEGEYTFRMPDGTEGMVVELIDYERDITTNLLLFDYTVTLPAGSNESRFALHIQPNKSGVTTGVEEAYLQPLPKGKGAKFLIDGKLMIRTAEGAVYDAQGHVVQ